MNTFILTFGIFSIAMMAMAVGVIVNNRAIKGSCGGLNDIDGLESACDICDVKEQCERRRKALERASSLSSASSNNSVQSSEKAVQGEQVSGQGKKPYSSSD